MMEQEILERNPIYKDMPKDKHTIRPCPYCSFDCYTQEELDAHESTHTQEEKSFLLEGDLTRIQNVLHARLHDISSRNGFCCTYDTCLHNYESAMERRFRIIINKITTNFITPEHKASSKSIGAVPYARYGNAMNIMDEISMALGIVNDEAMNMRCSCWECQARLYRDFIFGIAKIMEGKMK